MSNDTEADLAATINRVAVLAQEWKHLGDVNGSAAQRTLWECGDLILDAIVTEEAFVERRPSDAGANLMHWAGVAQHVTGEDCPCHPTLIPHANASP